MDKTQYYIPCIKVQDLIKANYNLTLDGNKKKKILISTLISPLIDQIQRITGKKDVFLKEIEKMGNSLGSFIPKGASTLVDDYGKKIVQNFGKEKLRSIAKLNFKNTEKILNEN